VGNDRPDRRTTASKLNTLHPNVDLRLLYKSQPFTDCFNTKTTNISDIVSHVLGKHFMG